jgi:hypothetical protein
MSYITLRVCWYDFLNVHSPTEDKTDDVKDIYKESESVFYKFLKYNMKILFENFNARRAREGIFKPTTGNKNLFEIGTDNGAHLKISVKSTLSAHRNIHKFTWASPDGKINNQIDYILIDKQMNLSVLNVRSFRAAGCDINHYLVVAKISERQAVNKKDCTDFMRGGSIPS